jgi:hypothetical protein
MLVQVLYLSNTLKLRETPKAFNYQATGRKMVVARLIASGMVTTLRDIWAIRSQAPVRSNVGKVQRLDGCGLVFMQDFQACWARIIGYSENLVIKPA